MGRTLFLIGMLLLTTTQSAFAWWHSDWSYRRKISLNTSASGAQIKTGLDQVPVLVRLHSGNFSFLDSKEDGSDIRFVLNDDKTPLKYHIELFDSVDELGLVWVQIPKLSPASTAEFMYVYFGNKGVGAGDDPKGTYGANETAVFHFNEKTGPPKDSTAYSNAVTASTAVLRAPGLIDGGGAFNGAAKISLSASPSLRASAANGYSVAAWVKVAGPQANAVILEQIDGSNAIRLGVDADKPFAEAVVGGNPNRAGSSTSLAPGKWHHLALTWRDRLVLYVDGVESATASVAAVDMGGAVTVGDTGQGGRAYQGDLDELQIANVAKSPDWIKLAAHSQGLDAKLLTFGEDEQSGAGGGNSYIAILLRAVTLDGWVVIGILAIMALISWWVMWAKAVFIGRMQKGNVAFQSHFEKLSTDLLSLANAAPATPAEDKAVFVKGRASPRAAPKDVRDSSLYRIYRLGVEELRHRFDAAEKAGRAKSLSPQSINAIRASLDAGLVRETHRLNKLIVLLTIAISGGPFLGLLGTVVGVMITFAAIAASGDVNVNSIAPGIAAALVATVAGLAVAIPALFGYNYLTSKIKDITAEMQVFADELLTKLAELYSK
jgi:biopolymer transport protein ExbB